MRDFETRICYRGKCSECPHHRLDTENKYYGLDGVPKEWAYSCFGYEDGYLRTDNPEYLSDAIKKSTEKGDEDAVAIFKALLRRVTNDTTN